MEVLAPLHPAELRLEQWYERIGDLAGGPVAGQHQALRAACGHWLSECALCREEVEVLHRQVAAGDGLS